MRLSEMMETEVVTVRPDATIGDARTAMRHHQIRHLPVVDGKRLVGILGWWDLDSGRLPGRRAVESFDETPVSAVMAEPATLRPQDTVTDAANLMRGRKVDCVTIAEKERLAGIVTAIDLLEFMSRHSTPSRIRPITRSREGRH